MNASVDSSVPPAESPGPRRGRAPRKPGDQATRATAAKVAKSKDAGKTKVSFYLDARTAAKLAVQSIIRGKDQSDLANEILGRAVSAVTFYDAPSPASSPAEQSLTVE